MSYRAQEWLWRSRSLSCHPPSLHDTTTTLKHPSTPSTPSTPRHHKYLSTLWLHNIPQNQDKKHLNCKMVTICFFKWLAKDQHNVLIFPHNFLYATQSIFWSCFYFSPSIKMKHFWASQHLTNIMDQTSISSGFSVNISSWLTARVSFIGSIKIFLFIPAHRSINIQIFVLFIKDLPILNCVCISLTEVLLKSDFVLWLGTENMQSLIPL